MCVWAQLMVQSILNSCSVAGEGYLPFHPDADGADCTVPLMLKVSGARPVPGPRTDTQGIKPLQQDSVLYPRQVSTLWLRAPTSANIELYRVCVQPTLQWKVRDSLSGARLAGPIYLRVYSTRR